MFILFTDVSKTKLTFVSYFLTICGYKTNTKAKI